MSALIFSIFCIIGISFFSYKLGKLRANIDSINDALSKKDREKQKYLTNIKGIEDDFKKIDTHGTIINAPIASGVLSGKIDRDKISKT